MVCKIIAATTLLAFASAGLVPDYHTFAALNKFSAAPEVSYSYNSAEAQATLAHAYAVPALKYVAPVVYLTQAKDEEHYEPSAPANYEFGYAVKDPHTGDSKSQKETRKGDTVHGSYSVVDPDGTKRTVEYTADDHHGFQAVVHKEPLYQKVIAAPIAVPLPTLIKSVAPAYITKPAYYH